VFLTALSVTLCALSMASSLLVARGKLRAVYVLGIVTGSGYVLVNILLAISDKGSRASCSWRSLRLGSDDVGRGAQTPPLGGKVVIIILSSPCSRVCDLCGDERDVWHVVLDLPDAGYAVQLCDAHVAALLATWREKDSSALATWWIEEG